MTRLSSTSMWVHNFFSNFSLFVFSSLTPHRPNARSMQRRSKTTKKRSKKSKRSKEKSVEINKPGLNNEVMRNIEFKLSIEVADVASPTPHVKETLESIAAGPIRRLTGRHHLPSWVECTEEERKRVGFIGNSITLKNVRYTRDRRMATVTRRTYTSKHQKNYFTVEEIVDIIVRFERLDRPKSCILNDGLIERDEVTFDGMGRFRGDDKSCFNVRWF